MENILYNYAGYQSQEKLRHKAERKQFKRGIEFLSGGLLLYTAFLFIGVIGFDLFQAIIIMITSGNDASERIREMEEHAVEAGGGMIIGVILGCIFMSLFFMKRLKLTEIAEHHRKMTPFTLLTVMSAVIVLQFIFTYIISFIEMGLNSVGLTTQQGIDEATAGSTTISMLIYAGFVGPFAEELIYRGFVMHTLQKSGCGKICAIVISSMFFGVMHANFTQTIFTFVLGLLFAYVAIEYGILWSFFLHVYNNFILGESLAFISEHISETAATIIDLALLGVSGIIVLIALMLKAKKVLPYIRENRSPAKYYGWTFSTVTTIVFFVLNMLMMLLTISKLKS